MAQFWIMSVGAGPARWALLPLAGSLYRFVSQEPYLQRVTPGAAAPGDALLACAGNGGNGGSALWLLLAPPASSLRVNGQPPLLGIRTLKDRDEVRLPSGPRLYFSTERLPEIVPFPGADHEIFCARCRSPIAPGTLAVCCPNCGAWCHETEELPCWSYPGSDHCPLCDQSNDPQAGYRWMPESLAHEN